MENLRAIVVVAVALCVLGATEALKLNTRIQADQDIQLTTEPVVLPQFNESLIQPKTVEESTLPPINFTLIQPKPAKNSQTKQATPLDCGSHTLNIGNTVVIQSPNHPSNYPRNYLCQWDFSAPGATSISIECSPFDVYQVDASCSASYLQLIGNSLNKKLCGQLTSVNEVTTGSTLAVTFQTNRVRRTGFSCQVTAKNDAPPTPAPDCLCGRVNRASRIVGGAPAEMHEYPWQVALTSSTGTQPFCGGTIICDLFIVTAAHCVSGKSPSTIRAVIGEHDWSTTSETTVTQRKEISQIIVHANYNSRTQDNDIALLKLKTPITFPTDNKIAPVCLPTTQNLYENVDAIITGWGTLASQGSQPHVLYEVVIPTMTNTQCQSSYGAAITSNMICAGLAAGGKDSCQGDSGGPMVTSNTGGTGTTFMELIGIVSWGNGCALPNYPGVYTRVTNYVAWISTNTAGCHYCSPP